MAITIKEFRLPTKEGRKTMTLEELIKTRDLYYEWYLMHEESMTFADAEKCMDHLRKFEDYIEERHNEEIDEL